MAFLPGLRLPTAQLLLCLLFVFATTSVNADAEQAEDANTLINEIGRESNQSLLWGPYKPNLYFGVRPRIPKSLSVGLMWAKVDNFVEVQHSFRHTCEQHAGMAGYGWEEYDVRNGGRQVIHDAGNKIDITTEFVKFPGGKHGGSWGARIKGVPRDDAPPDLKTTIISYASLEGLGSLEVANDRDPLGLEGDVTLQGTSDGLGDWKLVVTEGEGEHPFHATNPAYLEKPLARSIVHSFQMPEEFLWQPKGILFNHLKTVIDAYVERFGQDAAPPPWQMYTLTNDAGIGNMHMVQKVFEGEFEFEILFSSGSAPKEVTSDDLRKEIKRVTEAFSERFTEVFTPSAPYDEPKYLEFGKSMFSNLIGGIGYFYGDSVVDRSNAPEYEEENEGFWEETEAVRAQHREQLQRPSELYTSIPSRPFFPRGFLWDEGFHLIPIADWDMDLTLEIVKSWFNLMDEDGWIGREQILGDEARSKVPPEFQVQYPHYANPPTLYFILNKFIDKLSAAKESQSQTSGIQSRHIENEEVAMQYLQNIYPLLKRQYDWFHKTQAGDLKSYDRDAFSTKEAYRWRGRTVQHILTSGLDDYPRPQPPHPGELHVDLMSWMGMMTKSLLKISSVLNIPEDEKVFKTAEEAISKNLEKLHWSEKEKTYCDATIDDYEEHVLVCHKGYISIFPFLTGLLEAHSEKLGHVLELIGDEEELFSPHGLRSLSRKDEYYGTGENYWRGPVWTNMNYMAVEQLLRYAQTPGPYQAKAKDLYTRLRKNLVDTVFESWKETGFAWEQYNPETGAGQRTQHFTGWTSLVVKIMEMPDLSGGVEVPAAEEPVEVPAPEPVEMPEVPAAEETGEVPAPEPVEELEEPEEDGHDEL